MHRLAWIVIVAVACGNKQDKLPESKGSGSSEVAKPKEPDPPKSGRPRSLGELTAGSGSATGRPANDVAPKPVLKPVAGECTWRNQDVALFAVCEYRCSIDDREACALAAQMYFGGEGVKTDRTKALELATRACDLESGYGCTLQGSITNKSIELAAKAMPFDERDCTAGMPSACLNFALMLSVSDEKRAQGEFKKGYDLQRKACEGGDGAQCALLAAAHNTGGHGLPKDVMLAADLRKKACEHDHATTCFALSSETDKDDKRSALVEKACTLGLRKACAKLALELAGKNTTRVIQINQRACDLGDGESCVRIGEDFAKQDKKDRASEMFARACKLGSERGCSQARALGAK